MAMSLKLLPLLLIVSPIWVYTANEEKKHLAFFFDKLEAAPKDNKAVKVDLKVNKTTNNTFFISGTLETLVALDDKFKVNLDVGFSKKNGSSYDSLAKLPEIGVCAAMKTFYKNLIFDNLKKVCSNAPPADKCPVAVQKYEVKNYTLDLKKYEPLFKAGYYKLDLHLNGKDVNVTYTLFTYVTEVTKA